MEKENKQEAFRRATGKYPAFRIPYAELGDDGNRCNGGKRQWKTS